MDLSTFETKELVILWNSTANQQIKKFRDRKTAESRINGLLSLSKTSNVIKSLKEHPSLKNKIKWLFNVKKEKPIRRKNLRKAKLQGALQVKPTIKDLVIKLITTGLDNQSIIDNVRKEFTQSKFDMNHMAWYRTTLVRNNTVSAKYAGKRSKAYKHWEEIECRKT